MRQLLDTVLLMGLCLALCMGLVPVGMTGAAYAQGGDGPRPGVSLRFERIALEEGLSQSTVLAVLQDRQGFLWLGTQDGLNKYDGYGFEVYRHDPLDDGSLSTSFVQTIYEDRAGVLWVGTWGGGLNRFNPHTQTFTHYRHDPADPQSLADDIVLAVHEARGGGLWIGTAGGLDRFDPETERFTHYRHQPDDPHSLSQSFIWSMAEDSAGGLWIGTLGGGLNRLMPGATEEPASETGYRFKRYLHHPDDPASLAGNTNATVYVDRQGGLWVGTADGLDRYDPESDGFVHYRHQPDDPSSLCDALVHALYEDRDGGLWVGTANGLCRFDRAHQRFTHYRHNPSDPASLSHDVVRSLYEDRGGTLWIGTGGGGLSKYHRATERLGHYKHDPLNPASLSRNFVWDFQEDRSGFVWIGTDGGGLNRFDPETGRFIHFRHDAADPASLSDDVVLALAEDPAGALWVGTYRDGFNRFDPALQTFKRFPFDGRDDGLSNPSVNALHADTSGLLWIGTWGGGLNRFDPQTGRFTRYRHDLGEERSLSNDLVTCLLEDRAGVLWIGTNSGGLNRFDRQAETFARYLHDPDDPASLSHNTVYAVYEDRAGALWVATAGGLNQLDRSSGRFSIVTTRDGLPHNIIYAILEDEAGGLWLSTNAGLSHFDPATRQVRNYRVSDGLQSYEYNAGAAYTTRSGEMYFGGINGFNRFDPSGIIDNVHVPPVVLTGFRKFDEEVRFAQALSALDAIELSHRDNFITFEFAALDFVDPPNNRYAYRLDGVDKAWRYTDGTNRAASYTDLGGGDYVFHLKGANSDGVWNENGLALAVRVVPPFWATAWFRAMAGGGLLALVLGGGLFWHRTNLRKIERQRAETIEMQRRLAEGREAERVHMAHELHDGAVQDLYGARFQLETLASKLVLDEEDGRRMDGVHDTLRHVHSTLRDLCKELRPPLLESFGLAKAIGSHAARVREAHPALEVSCSLMPDGRALPERVRLALYRIYQEAVRNALRHADAQRIEVRLTFAAATIVLEVQDDGRGFEVPRRLVELARKDHLGLIGAAERAEAIGGTLRIDSAEGRGTCLRVIVSG